MRLLASAALVLLGTACLVPQEIEEMEPKRQGNDAPRIVLRAPVATTVVTQRDCTVTFSIDVEDFDRADGLEVRWFIDYGPDDAEPVDRATIPPDPDMRDGVRNPPGDSYTLRPRTIVAGSGNYVVVEAVVSDGFDPDPAAEPRNRAVLPGKASDETSWKLVITEEECVQ